MGILKAAATVAEASTVNGWIKQRQRERFLAESQALAAVPPPAPPFDGMNERLAQLERLGDLKNAGVLTDAEFEQQKARILTG